MYRKEKKDIYRDACQQAVREFTLAAREAEGEPQFEALFKTVCDTFRDDVQTQALHFGGLSESEASDLAFDGWEECRESLRARCHEVFLKVRKERSVVQIMKVSAEALVEPLVQKLGYPYFIECQKHRLKISVRLSYRKHFEFYLKYRDMNDSEILDSLVERTRNTIEYIEMFGPQVRLTRKSPSGRWTLPPGWRDTEGNILP